jgi:hypothetical protein
MQKKLRRTLSIGLLLISVYLLIWATLPNKHQVAVQDISPSEMQLPSRGQAVIPSILVSRQLSLEWPTSMRIGDKGMITLVFEPELNDSASPDALAEFSNVYDSYNLMAEGRFEAAGIRVDPANSTRESMPSGHDVKFNWQVNFEKAGSYPGNVWLSLRFLPLDGSQASQQLIYIHEVDIRATSLCGLSGPLARLLGGVGIILGVVVGINDMIALVRKWIGKTILTTDSAQRERPPTQMNADKIKFK